MIFAETARLILRRPVESDLEPLLRSWGDPKSNRYTPERSDVRAFLAGLIADMAAKRPGDCDPGGPWYQYVAERKEDGAVVGDVGVGFGVPGERQVELGYRVLPDWQRQGFGREAVAAIIDYLVRDHSVHRFVGVAASPNTASIALLRSLGFRREGHFRESFLCRGEWIDDDYFALLAREWHG